MADYASKAHDQSVTGFLLNVIPTTLVSALTEGDILQVLLVAILTGVAMSLVGEPARPLLALFESASRVVFRVTALLMRAAPIGAFGAIAFTVGKFGVGALASLGLLVATFYGTAILFVLVVLGAVGWACGFSILRLILYLKAELLLVLGTSSSEAALPSLIDKLERAGCAKPIVGLVVPTGYSFNLDGTNIYMTLATLFLAQAVGVDLNFTQYATIILVAMLTSKGASGVTGAGFITLAATLSAIPNSPVPAAAMTLVLGIDKFMSECRALTNLVGNGVACVVVSRWEGELDVAKLNEVMANPISIGTHITDAAPQPMASDNKVAAAE